MRDLIFKTMTFIHVNLFRSTRGRIGNRMFGTPVLLLTTVGRKSGKTRTVPVMAFEEGGDHYVIASKGGSPTHPAWYRNLKNNPDVTVEVKGDKYRARAVPVKGDERRRLYDHAVAQMKQFRTYERLARDHREIPVVRLQRVN